MRATVGFFSSRAGVAWVRASLGQSERLALFLFLVGIPGLSNTPSHWLICSGGQWRPLIFKRAQPRASARHDRAKSGRPGNQSPPAPRRSGQVVDIFRVKEKPRKPPPSRGGARNLNHALDVTFHAVWYDEVPEGVRHTPHPGEGRGTGDLTGQTLNDPKDSLSASTCYLLKSGTVAGYYLTAGGSCIRAPDSRPAIG